jgi:hypothetical protein
MNRILGIALLLAFTSVVWGQTSGNPFDLKYRPAKSNVPATPKPILTPADTLSKPGLPIRPSTVTPDTTKIVRDTTMDMPGSAISSDTLSVIGTNPFERADGKDSVTGVAETKVDSSANTKADKKLPILALKSKASRGFQIFFLLLSLLFLIFIVNVERSFVRDLWRVISNENYSSLHHRNQRNTMRQILLMMGYTVFIIQAGLFVYNSMRVFNLTGTVLDNVWTSIALVLCIYLTRHGVINYLRWLFNNEKELTLFGFDISIFNTMVGLVLVPINVLLIFGPENIHKPLVIIGVIAIVLAYMTRQLRWVLTARQLIANSLFLFFVYLCAVEILPLWAISKIFW